MNNWFSLPILILAALFQATFMPQIRLLNGTPDLVFLFVVAWSANSSLESAVSWAFVGGIARDLMSATPTGTSALGLILVVFLVHEVRRHVYSVGIALFVGFVIVGTVVEHSVVLLVLALTGYPVRLVEGFTSMILPTVAYNLVFIGPIYWFVRRLQRRIGEGSHVIT